MPAIHANAVVYEDGITLYFSPRGGCADAIIGQINQAKIDVLVQAYYFTSAKIAKALLAAHKRGVRVQVLLDRSQRTAKYSSATFFVNQGIPVLIDAKHRTAHNKIIVIDSRVVITGSFNFTRSAEESNTENLLIIEDKPKLTAAYVQNFAKHLEHSEPNLPPTDVQSPE